MTEQRIEFMAGEVDGLVMRATFAPGDETATVLVMHTGWQTGDWWQRLAGNSYAGASGHQLCRPRPWQIEFHGSQPRVPQSDARCSARLVCPASGANPCYIRADREGASPLFDVLVEHGSARFWEAVASRHRQQFNRD